MMKLGWMGWDLIWDGIWFEMSAARSSAFDDGAVIRCSLVDELVMAGCSSAFHDGAVVRCLLVCLRQWRGDPLLARRLRSVVIIIHHP